MTLILPNTQQASAKFYEKLSPWIGKQICFRGTQDIPCRFRVGTIRKIEGDSVEGYSPSASAFVSQENWIYPWYEFQAMVNE